MPKGVLGWSTADNGDFEYGCPPPRPTASASNAFTFSALFCFLEKVDIDRAGRDALDAGAFSGEKERVVARVAVEGVFRWEDVEAGERGEVVRSEADRRNVEPSSVTELEML